MKIQQKAKRGIRTRFYKLGNHTKSQLRKQLEAKNLNPRYSGKDKGFYAGPLQRLTPDEYKEHRLERSNK